MWQSIDTAPKDKPILGWIDSLDDDCPNCGPLNLCLYHMHLDVGISRSVSGPAVIVWGGSWDDRNYENPGGGYLPDWWFRYGSDFEEVANPTHWVPVQAFPE